LLGISASCNHPPKK